MPEFTFTSPTGETYKMTGPEGSTKEQAFEKFKSMKPDLFKKAAPAKEEGAFLSPDEKAEQRKGYRARLAGIGEVTPETKEFEKPALKGGLGRQLAGAAEGFVAGIPGAPGALGQAFNIPGLRALPTGPQIAMPIRKMFGEVSPAEASGMETGAMFSPLKVPSAAISVAKAPGKIISSITGKAASKDLAEALAAARARGDELISKATTEAEKEQAVATKNRLIAQTMASRQQSKAGAVPQETEALESLSRKEAGLGAPEGASQLQSQTDVNSKLRQVADARLKAAEETQKTVGGEAFERYKNVAKAKQATEPFGVSSEGQALKSELDEVASGGAGTLKKYGQSLQELAKKVRNELFGKPVGEISDAEVFARAEQNPNKSMSMPVKIMQARKELEALASSERKPVDFKIVDDLIREYRQKQSGKAAEGFTQVERDRLGSLANKIEDSLKKWVGEANYPRAEYAASSEELNKFRSKLGEALTGREEIKYLTEAGAPSTKTESLSGLVFGSKDNVKMAKQLLGEADVNALGEQYVINQLAGKDASAVSKWLGDAENSFVYEIPGLPEKLTKYGTALARRQGDAAVAKKLVEQYNKGKEIAGAVETRATQNLDKLKNTLDDLRIKIMDWPAAKIQEEWAKTGGLRKALEDTGRFSSEQLDALAQDVSAISKAATKVERGEKARALMLTIGKWAGLPIAGYKLGSGAIDLFRGD